MSCGSKSEDNKNTPTTVATVPATSYYMSNNSCYNNAGQIVATTYCSNVGGVGGQCIGYFYYQGQLTLCNGADCRGYTLINAQTNQPQTCM